MHRWMYVVALGGPLVLGIGGSIAYPALVDADLPRLGIPIDAILNDRGSDLDAVDIRGTLHLGNQADLEVAATFASSDGGHLPVPPACSESEHAQTMEACSKNVRLDGRPVTVGPRGVHVGDRRGTIAYRVEGTGLVTDAPGVPLLPPDSGARLSDPPFDVSVALELDPNLDQGALIPHAATLDPVTLDVSGTTAKFTAPTTADHGASIETGADLLNTFLAPEFGAVDRDLDGIAAERNADHRARAAANVVIVLAVVGIVCLAFWTAAAVFLIRNRRAQRQVVKGIAKELADPPSPHDPSVVAVLASDGKAAPQAIAGTLLGLAAQNIVEFQHLGGESFLVHRRDGKAPALEAERVVLAALEDQGLAPNQPLQAPPLWKARAGWWRRYRRDAIRRARRARLIQYACPPFPVITAATVTGIYAAGLGLGDTPLLAIAVIVLSPVAAQLTCLRIGNALTDEGRVLKAKWRAFGQYIENQGELHEVPPAGIVNWGPYLIYGVVLGGARGAAAVLTPEV